MRVDGHIPSSTGKGFPLPIRYMDFGFGVTIMLGHSEICLGTVSENVLQGDDRLVERDRRRLGWFEGHKLLWLVHHDARIRSNRKRLDSITTAARFCLGHRERKDASGLTYDMDGVRRFCAWYTD